MFTKIPLIAQDVNYGYTLGSIGTDNATDIAIDKSDNTILVGNFSGIMDLDPSAGTYNLTTSNDASFIAKYNNLGELIWAEKIEASGSGACGIYSLVLDDLDNIHILISITSTTDLDPSANTNNVLYSEGPLFIAKYDKNGNYISNVGSLTFFNYPKLSIDKNANLFVLSSFSGNFDIDPTASTFTLTNIGNVDLFVAKYNSSLNFISAFSIGGANNEKGNSIFIDSLDNIFIAGKFEGTTDFDNSGNTFNLTAASDYDGFIAKYNSNFELQFAKKISGTEDQEIMDLVIYDQNIYVTGSFEKDIDTDPDIGTEIYIMQGLTVGKDIWFAKYNYTDGSLVDSWHIIGGGTFPSEGVKIRIDEWGYIYLGMVSWGNNDYDPASGIYNIPVNSKDITLAKYSNNGAFIWAGSIAGGDLDYLNNMEFDSNYNLLLAGEIFNLNVNFDINGGTLNSNVIGGLDIMFASYALKIPPSINLNEMSIINTNSISGNFELLNNGNSNIQTIGFVIKEGSNPSIDDNDFIYYYSKDSLEFSFEIGNLYSNTVYKIKAFATNDEYTGYSNLITLTTLFTDEDAAPNNGDGNNDGILDSRQSNVLSIKSSKNTYITIVELNGLEIYDGEIFEQREITSEFYFPLGEVGFKIDSNYARIKLYFEGINDFSSYVFRKRLSNEKYNNLTLLNIGTDTIAGNPTAYIEFELFDGSPFDNDGLVNGIIYDPGGPVLPITEENIPTLSYWARIIMLSSFALFGVWSSSKKFIS